MTSSGVRETLHLKKSNLVQAACKDVHDMTVMRYSLCEIVVELFVSVVELRFKH